MGFKFARSFSLLSFLFALILPAAYSAQNLTKVVETSGSFSERDAVNYVAQDQGFFRRYGLDLTFVIVRNGPVGMAAPAPGENHLHSRPPTPARLRPPAERTDLVVRPRLTNK